MSEAQRDSGELGVVGDGRPDGGKDAKTVSSVIAVHSAGRTAVGQVRDHNEDNFVVANLGTGQLRPRDVIVNDDVNDCGILFAVCDGMGGAAAGEVASQMAVDILVEAMRRGGAPKNRDGLARRLVSAVEEAGKRIYDAAQKERSRRGMGTTATVSVLVDKVLFLAEVGDSRAYLLRGGQLKQLTKDQSLVNQLIEAGHLTEAEAEAFEHSNIILQALGTSETVQVDLTFVELRRGDRLMMCSDGLSGLVHNDTMRETLAGVADPVACASKLIEQAEAAGGHDNITVVVADFDGEALALPAEGDNFGYLQYPLPLADDESAAFVDEDTERSSSESGKAAGEAGEAASPSVRPAQRSAPKKARDQGESLLPLSGDPGDGQGSLIWVAVGALALAAGVAVWIQLEPEAERLHPPREELAMDVPPPLPAAPVVQDVDVQVHTDVERATLLVNGEAHGDLGPGTSKTLKLKPGAYRFEAQSQGNPAAVSIVTVGDTPMDVFLQLPKAPSPAPEPGREPEDTQRPVAARPAPQAAEPAPAPKAAPEPQAPAPTPTVAKPRPTPPPSSAAPPGAVADAATPNTPSEPVAPRPPRKRSSEAAPAPAPAAPSQQEIPENPF